MNKCASVQQLLRLSFDGVLVVAVALTVRFRCSTVMVIVLLLLHFNHLQIHISVHSVIRILFLTSHSTLFPTSFSLIFIDDILKCVSI